MPESTFTFRVDDALKSAFADTAKQQDRTAAQLLRDFMREYVNRNQENAAYNAWFQQKVEAGLSAIRNGDLLSNEEAEARAKIRREAILEGRKAQ